MPVMMEEMKKLATFVEWEEKHKCGERKLLGDLLAELGKEVKGANPTEDIRKMREDEDVFG